MGLQCRAGSGRGLLSAMEGTVMLALMVHNSPKIHGLHEIIKSEVDGEWTLGFISASLQAGHGKRAADLSKTLPRQCRRHGTHQAAAPSPQCHPAVSLMLGTRSHVPNSRAGPRAPPVP